MNVQEMYWLAGLLEGEGTFHSTHTTPEISIGMVDEDVMTKVSALLDCVPFCDVLPTGKTRYRISLTGNDAIVAMKCLFPLMGKRRQEQIQKALDIASLRPRRSRKVDWPKLD